MKRPLLAAVPALALAALLQAAPPALADPGGAAPSEDQGAAAPPDAPAYQGGAQAGGDQAGGEQAGGDQGGGGQGGGGDSSAAPVTLSDAKANVGTLIESFIAQHSEGGVWPLRDKRTGQLRKLKLVKVDDKHVKPAGKSRFAAPASLKDEATGQTLEASFIADFSGPDWKVVGMRLKPAAAKKGK